MANGAPYGAAIDNGVRRAGADGNIWKEKKKSQKLKSHNYTLTLTSLAG